MGRTWPTAPPPLVLRRRHGARHPAGGRPGLAGTAPASSGRRSSSSALKAEPIPRPAGLDGPAPPTPRWPTRPHLEARGGQLPLRAFARPGDAGGRGLRRSAMIAFTAHPELCPRPASCTSSATASSRRPDLRRARRLRRLVDSAPITVRQADDDPRLHHHEGPRHLHGPPGRVRPAGRRPPRRAPAAGTTTYDARIGIFPLGTDADIRWFEIDPCYVFFLMNVFVDGSWVVCDVGRDETMWRGSIDNFAPSSRTAGRSIWTKGEVTERSNSTTSRTRFPRVDVRFVGLRHRFGWAASLPGRPR